VAVLSHAMLLIASLFAAPLGGADSAACQGVDSGHTTQSELSWAPEHREITVRALGASRMRQVSSLRVLGRCVVRAAPENPQRVLFGLLGAQTDDPDDEDLASTRAEARPPFARPTPVGIRPTDVYVLRAPLTQLDRPPRV
jgi:hypothetical protein